MVTFHPERAYPRLAMKRLSFLVVCLIAAVGCVSTKPTTPRMGEFARTIQPGKTTLAEIVAVLGEPVKRETRDDAVVATWIRNVAETRDAGGNTREPWIDDRRATFTYVAQRPTSLSVRFDANQTVVNYQLLEP